MLESARARVFPVEHRQAVELLRNPAREFAPIAMGEGTAGRNRLRQLDTGRSIFTFMTPSATKPSA